MVIEKGILKGERWTFEVRVVLTCIRYYAYRLKGEMKDPRLNCFKKEWFEGKKCWDIGCNAGEITIEIGRLTCNHAKLLLIIVFSTSF